MLLGLSVCWLEVMFAIGFVCLLVCGHVITQFFLPLVMLSVLGLFHYRIKAIPWILNYKWADYCYVMCITMGYLFHVWGGVGFFFVISICTELLCFWRGI